MDKSVSILTTQSKNVFKIGTVQTMMSEFNYKSDEFYNSDEGTKASSESNTLDKEKVLSRRPQSTTTSLRNARP